MLFILSVGLCVLAFLILLRLYVQYYQPRWVAKVLWRIYGYTYDGLRNFYPYQHLVRQTVAWLEIKPGETVLDLGCGTGNALELALSHQSVKAKGIDISPTMIATARRKLVLNLRSGHLELQQGDLLDILKSTPSDSVDKIISINVFYALTNRSAIWEEALRILKPNGLMVVTSSTRTGSWPIIKEHLDHAPWHHLLGGRLVGVFLVDSVINTLGNVGQFAFPSADQLQSEVEAAGGSWLKSVRCYGGSQHGVNVLFSLTKK